MDEKPFGIEYLEEVSMIEVPFGGDCGCGPPPPLPPGGTYVGTCSHTTTFPNEAHVGDGCNTD